MEMRVLAWMLAVKGAACSRLGVVMAFPTVMSNITFVKAETVMVSAAICERISCALNCCRQLISCSIEHLVQRVMGASKSSTLALQVTRALYVLMVAERTSVEWHQVVSHETVSLATCPMSPIGTAVPPSLGQDRCFSPL